MMSQTDAEEKGIFSSRRGIKLRTYKVERSAPVRWRHSPGWRSLGIGRRPAFRLSAFRHFPLFLLCQSLCQFLGAVNEVHLEQATFSLSSPLLYLSYRPRVQITSLVRISSKIGGSPRSLPYWWDARIQTLCHLLGRSQYSDYPTSQSSHLWPLERNRLYSIISQDWSMGVRR